MYYVINPAKDATIYSNSSSMNAGLDEILEVEKMMETSVSYHLVRALVQFDVSTDNFPLGASASGSRQFVLRLFATEPERLNITYDVQVAAVSQSWTMGAGKRFNTPQTTEGVCWLYRTGGTAADHWASASDDFRGGTWFSGSGQTVTQSFEYENPDLAVDVTPIVEQWLDATLPNNGFLIKFTDSEETSSTTYGSLKFFSCDSNTVYKPQLMLKYDDSSYPTSSTSVSGTLNADDTVVYVRGLKTEYRQQAVEKIRVIARDRYPSRTFSVTQSMYTTFNYLPTSSYFGVQDAYTNRMVIDFDTTYGKLSNDASGNYFNFNFNSLFTNRLYKFMFKVQRGSLTTYYESDALFKVVK